MCNKKVQILLSTFNGELYLKNLLDSLIKQDYHNLSILIRDDGSCDNTISIIKKYALKHKIISFYLGVNIGVVKSYWDLMKHADPDADYYAFCDQDDYWLPQKISIAIGILEKIATNIKLYCSNVILTNSDLLIYKKQLSNQIKSPSFGNALVENICIGCTAVFSNSSRKIFLKAENDYIVMHDWWMYIVVSYYGHIVYDKNAYVLYRQHQNNQLGATSNIIIRMIKRMRLFKKNTYKLQALYFRDCYNKKGVKIYDYDLEVFCSYDRSILYKTKLLFSKRIKRQSFIDNIIFKILIIFNLI